MEFDFRISELKHGESGSTTWCFKGPDPVKVIEKFKQEYPENFRYATTIYLNIGKGCWDVQTILHNRSQVLKDFYSSLKFKVIKNGRTIVVCGTIEDALQYFEDYDADEIQRVKS